MPSNRFTLKRKIFQKIIFTNIYKIIRNIIQLLQLLRDKMAININSFKVKNHPAADHLKKI